MAMEAFWLHAKAVDCILPHQCALQFAAEEGCKVKALESLPAAAAANASSAGRTEGRRELV